MKPEISPEAAGGVVEGAERMRLATEFETFIDGDPEGFRVVLQQAGINRYDNMGIGRVIDQIRANPSGVEEQKARGELIGMLVDTRIKKMKLEEDVESE